jgi:hypothetical protein
MKILFLIPAITVGVASLMSCDASSGAAVFDSVFHQISLSPLRDNHIKHGERDRRLYFGKLHRLMELALGLSRIP